MLRIKPLLFIDVICCCFVISVLAFDYEHNFNDSNPIKTCPCLKFDQQCWYYYMEIFGNHPPGCYPPYLSRDEDANTEYLINSSWIQDVDSMINNPKCWMFEIYTSIDLDCPPSGWPNVTDSEESNEVPGFQWFSGYQSNNFTFEDDTFKNGSTPLNITGNGSHLYNFPGLMWSPPIKRFDPDPDDNLNDTTTFIEQSIDLPYNISVGEGIHLRRFDFEQHHLNSHGLHFYTNVTNGIQQRIKKRRRVTTTTIRTITRKGLLKRKITRSTTIRRKRRRTTATTAPTMRRRLKRIRTTANSGFLV